MDWLFFGVGAAICSLNAYLSWLRYPLHRLRGRPEEDYRHASGIPLLGTLLVVLGWFGGAGDGHSTVLDVAVVVLVLVDTGGPHWFLASVLWHRLRRDAGRAD